MSIPIIMSALALGAAITERPRKVHIYRKTPRIWLDLTRGPPGGHKAGTAP